MKRIAVATALLCAVPVPAGAQAPTVVKETVMQPDTRTVCLVDSAFGWSEKTPTLCFAAAQNADPKTFWRSFTHVLPKPKSVDDVDAFFDIRTGDAVIGKETGAIPLEAQAALSRCWARFDRLKDTGEKIPSPVCN